VNKIDLLPHLDFDVETFIGNLTLVNPEALVTMACATTGGVSTSGAGDYLVSNSPLRGCWFRDAGGSESAQGTAASPTTGRFSTRLPVEP
jgi:hypothetical protein